MKIYFSIISLLLLSACSSIPKNLESDSATLVTNYPLWKASDPAQKLEVRMAGVVAKVENKQDKTRIEVANIPVDSAGKPNLAMKPQGRFIAYVDGFVDPLNIKPNTYVTFLGVTEPSEHAKIGEFDYEYPVMKVESMRVWQKSQVNVVNPQFNFCYGGYHHRHRRGFNSSFCSGFYGPQRIDSYEVLR